MIVIMIVIMITSLKNYLLGLWKKLLLS